MNLLPNDKPQDVYTVVLKIVIDKVWCSLTTAPWKPGVLPTTLPSPMHQPALQILQGQRRCCIARPCPNSLALSLQFFWTCLVCATSAAGKPRRPSSEPGPRTPCSKASGAGHTAAQGGKDLDHWYLLTVGCTGCEADHHDHLLRCHGCAPGHA